MYLSEWTEIIAVMGKNKGRETENQRCMRRQVTRKKGSPSYEVGREKGSVSVKNGSGSEQKNGIEKTKGEDAKK